MRLKFGESLPDFSDAFGGSTVDPSDSKRGLSRSKFEDEDEFSLSRSLPSRRSDSELRQTSKTRLADFWEETVERSYRNSLAR